LSVCELVVLEHKPSAIGGTLNESINDKSKKIHVSRERALLRKVKRGIEFSSLIANSMYNNTSYSNPIVVIVHTTLRE
jgi:hypothetical protein